ncbi:precorrin-3B synthase [Frateuria aurantia]
MASHTACPGLLHIVPAADGGLCRIKLPGGRLQAPQALAIAEAARKHASGVMEITNRANLQLRGVVPGQEPALVELLTQAGLGPLPAENATTYRARDERRNVMISPTAGIDPQQRMDTRPLAAALLEAIQQDDQLEGLSPKFAILIDGGERLLDRLHPHDIWLSVNPPRPSGPPRLRLGLAGSPTTAGTGGCLGEVDLTEVVPTVLALIKAFLALAPASVQRMRQLIGGQDAGVLQQRATALGARFHPLTLAAPPVALPPEPTLDPFRLGLHPQLQPGLCYVGFQLPLARLDAFALAGLAGLAERHGQGELRLSPWQGGLLPDVPTAQGEACLRDLQALGLICDHAMPLARLLACAGCQGCARTQADTKADARWLAEQPLPWASIHLSGCPRSCAAATPAAFTLLAVDAGHYDLHCRGPGPAPGPRLGRHLSLQQAAEALGACGAEPLHV